MCNLKLFIPWIPVLLAPWDGTKCQGLIGDFPEDFKNISTEGVKMIITSSFPIDNVSGHLQGVQLFGENTAYISGSAASTSYMLEVDLRPPAKVKAVHRLMPDPYRHAGGFQVYKQYLAVGVEDNLKRTSSKVTIYDIGGENKDWTLPLYTIEREGPFEKATAGAVGITGYKDEILVAVANWNSRNIDFYVCPASSFKNHTGEFKQIASLASSDVFKGNWLDPFWWSYQNINLFTDAKQGLYLAGFAKDRKGQHRADVFQISIVGIEQGDKGLLKSQRKVQLKKIISKTFTTTGGTDFGAGAGLNIKNDGSLVLVSCPYSLEQKPTLDFFYPFPDHSASRDSPMRNIMGKKWRKTGELPAEEATQASAATKSHVYAINNGQVVQYHRGTGEKTALSTGVAKHLNSGFFWKNKLYLAHSNYPNKPDSSDIRSLDPTDMKLDIFKQFGESEGSLTWAIRLKNNWWCMFAYYGKENHKSYLARFNGDWEEKERWTFPQEIIEKLGTMSISGGLWKDGGFWVSGHDERELYRVRLPKEGSVLQFVETVPAPFTGQGIADDPLTGGLVGIDRKGRKIIFSVLEK